MSDEEKKAIEILKDREYDFDELYCTFRQSFIKPYDKSIGIILELIEKQQKEIEELKNADLTTVYLNGVYDGEKKVQDKIKAKIEELQEDIKYSANPLSIDNSKFGIKVLQSLLEKE